MNFPIPNVLNNTLDDAKKRLYEYDLDIAYVPTNTYLPNRVMAYYPQGKKLHLDVVIKPKDSFSLDENMKVSKTEDTFEPVSKIDEEIYPMYIPENTSLTDKETVSLDNGERVIMTFEGDNPFMFVQQTASLSDEETILSVMGEPCQMATGVAAVSDNMVSWISNGIEYYVVADNMSESELLNVANSVSVLPVSK